MEYKESVKNNQLQSALKEFGQVSICMERFSVADSEDNNFLFMTTEDMILEGLVSPNNNRPEVITCEVI